MAFIPNYSSYFSFPKHKTGYSGVVSYCDQSLCPFGVEDSLLNWNEILNKETDDSFDSINNFNERQTLNELKKVDCEGRVIITKHLIEMNDSLINLFIFNTYCPCADPEKPQRLQFKLNFYSLLEEKVKQLIKSSDNNYVIILGDVNTSHQRIDNCDPSDDFESDPSRQWLCHLLSFNDREDSSKPYFIDVFRYLYPDRRESYTCWNTKSGARLTNYGTRIDYIISDARLKHYIKDCVILSDVLGSDHCPVMIEFKNIKPIASNKLSKLCTKFWPEFGNSRQSSLKSYLTKGKDKNSSNEEEMRNNINVKKIKITARQTTLSNYFTNRNNESNTNKSTQSCKCDNNELEIQVMPKRGNELINTNSCSTKSCDNSQVIQINCDNESAAQKWKQVFKPLPKPPNCLVHCEPCVSRKVTKLGPNYGKQFYVCDRPIGNANNPKSRCNFFKWAKDCKN